MEVHFTPDQEAQLAQLASQTGTDVEHLVKDAALRLLASGRVERDSEVAADKARRFEHWARSHPPRPPLPDSAFRRHNMIRNAG